MDDERLLQDFPPVSTRDWEAAMRADLEGAEVETLVWRPGEPFTVKPFYRAEDLDGLGVPLDSAPGRAPFVRGLRAGSTAWQVAEELAVVGGQDAEAAARDALAGGAEALVVTLPPGTAALPALPYQLAPFHLRGQAWTPALVRALPGAGSASAGTAAWRGSADVDPLGALAEQGASPVSASELFQLAAAAVERASPDARTLAVRSTVYAESGASITQQVAFGLTHAVEYLARLSDLGLAPGQVARAMFFATSTGPGYFLEIAKLRALRLLWSRVVTAFGAPPEAAAVPVHARTTLWNKTRYDAHVNILRATTEAMSAVIGGCDTLVVGASTDGGLAPDADARRLARNTQLILKHEAHLDLPADPAGGAYFVEALTDAIAREAWAELQRIEAAGGHLAALQSGAIQREVARVRGERLKAFASRREALIGTNQYPDPAERTLARAAPAMATVPAGVGEAAAIAVQPLTAWRAAEPFEWLRARTERHLEAGGALPRIVLLLAGDPRLRQARAAFCTGFFGCAGLPVQDVATVAPHAAVRELAEGRPDLVVLCSSDPEYPALAAAVVPALRAAGVAAPVLVAGYPADAVEALRRAGIADFVHVRSHPVETLSRWQDALGVRA